jgi:hypothetical protein
MSSFDQVRAGAFTGAAPARLDHPAVRELFEMLREFRVTRYVTPTITVEMALPSQVSDPSTPEQSGKKDPPRPDIHDVLASGVIPGAPVVDPILTVPSLDE